VLSREIDGQRESKQKKNRRGGGKNRPPGRLEKFGGEEEARQGKREKRYNLVMKEGKKPSERRSRKCVPLQEKGGGLLRHLAHNKGEGKQDGMRFVKKSAEGKRRLLSREGSLIFFPKKGKVERRG